MNILLGTHILHGNNCPAWRSRGNSIGERETGSHSFRQSVLLGYGYYFSISYKHKTATGKERISRHLGNMMGGTIAVITAVLVDNV